MARRNPVLIVDDERDSREALALLVRNQRFDVVTAEDGDDALRKLATMPRPGIIFLDLMMPGMNGWDMRAQLLKRRDLADVPVVLMSGRADIDEVSKRLRAVDYLRKPVELPRLYSLVERYC